MHVSYEKRPSWKTYGDGRAIVEAIRENDGSISLRCQEIPENFRGAKDVFVSVPKSAMKAFTALVNGTIKSVDGKIVPV